MVKNVFAGTGSGANNANFNTNNAGFRSSSFNITLEVIIQVGYQAGKMHYWRK